MTRKLRPECAKPTGVNITRFRAKHEAATPGLYLLSAPKANRADINLARPQARCSRRFVGQQHQLQPLEFYSFVDGEPICRLIVVVAKSFKGHRRRGDVF